MWRGRSEHCSSVTIPDMPGRAHKVRQSAENLSDVHSRELLVKVSKAFDGSSKGTVLDKLQDDIQKVFRADTGREREHVGSRSPEQVAMSYLST